MDYRVELVAQAFYEVEEDGSRWDNLPAVRKQQFREFARNAINLLNDDMGVLLPTLETSSADQRVRV